MSKPAEIEDMMAYARRRSSAGSTSWSTTPASSMWPGSRTSRRALGRDHRDQPVQRIPRHTAGTAGDAGGQWGRIINVASVHGLVASAEKSAYVAAKHGIVGLTKVTALENATVASPATRSARAGC
jgi:3-hydroxybutyrate dehydrogenase